MLIIPAIDLKDGRCVRLKQGVMEDATVFSEDPAAMAGTGWRKGARRLHLVDLNGAFAGKPRNEAAIKAIVEAVGDSMPVQLGGGIRDLDTIERYLDDGISYRHHRHGGGEEARLPARCLHAFPGMSSSALDAKDGKVAVEGWSKMTGHDVIDLAKKFQDYGVEAIIYTDIGRDGMLSGVNIDATVELAQAHSACRSSPAAGITTSTTCAPCANASRGHRGCHHRARDLPGHARLRAGAEAGGRAAPRA